MFHFTHFYVFLPIATLKGFSFYNFSHRIYFEGNPGVGLCTLSETSSASVIRIPEDMSYRLDQSTPSAFIESSSGLVTSAPSSKNLAQNNPGMTPSFDMHSTIPKPHSLPDLCLSGISSRTSPTEAGSVLLFLSPRPSLLLLRVSVSVLLSCLFLSRSLLPRAPILLEVFPSATFPGRPEAFRMLSSLHYPSSVHTSSPRGTQHLQLPAQPFPGPSPVSSSRSSFWVLVLAAILSPWKSQRWPVA